MTATGVLAATTVPRTDDGLIHMACCHVPAAGPARAFCGAVTDGEAGRDEPVDCVVCRDLHRSTSLDVCPISGGSCP